MAGSVTYKKNKIRVGNDIVEEHVWAWTADSGDGSVPDTVTDDTVTGYLMNAKTDPGTTAPTALYDIALNDDDAVDVFQAELNNRSAADSEQVLAKVGNAYGEPFINSVLTMVLTNNSVNSAVGELKVYVRVPSP
jgi:hypothetical protein